MKQAPLALLQILTHQDVTDLRAHLEALASLQQVALWAADQ